jgi:D-amino-acid dehydrogenase
MRVVTIPAGCEHSLAAPLQCIDANRGKPAEYSHRPLEARAGRPGITAVRIAVVGAGIVGVASAYELARDGHEVTVIERRAAVASETSFANAGVVAPGYVTPWAAPGVPAKVLRQCFARDAAVRFGAGSLAMLPWFARFLAACRPRVHAANRGAMQALADLSRERLVALTAELGLAYEQSSGYVVLLRGERELKAARRGLALLADLGVAFELLDAARCRALEPALHEGTPLRAGIHLPRAVVGNCRQFAHALKGEAAALGARFLFETPVLRIAAARQPTLELGGANGPATLEVDRVLLCTGVEGGARLAGAPLALPLAPVHGYSITAPMALPEAGPAPGPRAALMDERYKVAITRLGHRVRVAGSAEVGARGAAPNAAALRTLYRVLDDWFPGSAVLPKVQTWRGARPMLPDGPPVIGATRAEGVWWNLGHGSSGWALACGSARVVADAIAGRPPVIDTARFAWPRPAA